jgi:PKHD-type hydroxylase
MFTLGAHRSRAYRAFEVAAGAFRPDELDCIARIGDSRPSQAATIGTPEGSVLDTGYRTSRITWLRLDAQTEFLFQRLCEVVEVVNRERYQFELTGFDDALQYTVYEAPSVGYDWHVDLIDAPWNLQRKLSLTLQLSDEADYEGGELEFRDGASVVAAPRERGLVTAFPSWTQHRVRPVTRAVRRSVVAWVGGPSFR